MEIQELIMVQLPSPLEWRLPHLGKIPTALPIPSINYTTALDFNGSSDYIRVDNFSGVSSSFSVSLWFNLGTSALAQRNFLELMNPSTANLNQRIFISSAGTIIASQNSGAGWSSAVVYIWNK